jgi:pullulanase/glycogen debranching enzyme
LIREVDNYNWGYDPFHYTVPERSYAQVPDGSAGIIEFPQMVQSIHNLGFRVIMDVVYNHTHQAG